ncbi:MAG TPA: protein kinase [Vicinamibacteria bacterium]|nr:protein kinase [Vicinamibacteria bacterium]
MVCPGCRKLNEDSAEHCFFCGRALDAITQGVLLGGRYEVLRPVGKGGMGRVYKARDRTLDEDVAVKVLRAELVTDPEMAHRFRSEIKIARKVSHPNVCRIHDYGEDQGLLFISMEFIDGLGLKEQLATHPVTVEGALEIVLQIARGLAAVHRHGIVHRDFKVTNIMVDARGVVKLMDFGIAKDMAADTTGVTRTGQIFGTPEYMSPEQAGGRKVDFRSDIYSLGCVVFEVFTGEAPFKGHTPLATLYKHAREEPRLDHPALPPALRPVIARALAKDPAERYASVGAFIDALVQARTEIDPAEASRLLAHPARAPGPPTSTLGESAELSLPALSVPQGPGAVPSLAPPTRRRGGSRERVWPVAVGALAISAAFLALRERSDGVPPAVSPGPAAGTEAPASTQQAAPATLATLEPSAASAKPHREPAPKTTAPRPVPSPPAAGAAPEETLAPSPPAPAPSVEVGRLRLLVSPAAEVTIDGASIGSVSVREVPLAPGRHVVRIQHADYQPLQRVVSIAAGIETPLVIDLREKGIRVAR